MKVEIQVSDRFARISKLKTKHGIISCPTLFPVHDIGSYWMGNTPEFWKIFPKINTCMFNASNLKSNKSIAEIAIKKGIHALLQFNGIAFVDSGGWTYRRRGFSYSVEDILHLQEDMGADIASTLDFPINMYHSSNSDISQSVANAIRASKKKNDRKMILLASIHANDPSILRNIVRVLKKKACFDGFAIGSLMTIYQNYSLLIDIVLALRREAPGDLIHVYGLAGPIISQLLAYLGVDSMDSSSFVISASKKSYIIPGIGRCDKRKILEEMKSPRGMSNCKCSICRKYSIHKILERRELLSLHNLWTSWDQMEQFKIALKENRLEKYMKELFLRNKWASKALHYALCKIR